MKRKYDLREADRLARMHGLTRQAVTYAWRHGREGSLGTGKSSRTRSDEVSAHLSILCSVSSGGLQLSLREIGDFCGISKQAIHLIEGRALRRVRELFRERGLSKEWKL